MAAGMGNWHTPRRLFKRPTSTRGVRTENRRDRRQRRLAVEPLESRLLLALMAQWDFDEGSGSLATDSSGNGNTGQLFGPSWVQQGTGYALSMDGRDDYADFGPATALGIGGPLTLEAWIKPTRKAHSEAVLLGESLSTYLLTYYNTEISLFYIGSGANSVKGDLTLHEWNHIVATFDGTDMAMSINGRQVYQRESLYTDYSPVGNFMMGTKDRPDLPSFKGLIDKVRVYDHALSAQDAEDHFLAEAETYGYDPFLFTNPKVTPYLYLHDDEPSIVIDAEYGWLNVVDGQLDVTVSNALAPGEVLLQRNQNPVPDSGFVETILPLSGLENGDYLIDVNFSDFYYLNYTNQFSFSLPVDSGNIPSPAEHTVGPLPSDNNLTPFGFSLNQGGGFDVTINGTPYPFQSRISWPWGDYNLLGETASGEAAWQVTTQNLGANQYRVTASGNYYSLDRQIEVFPTHISVEDTYTNDWEYDLGLLIYNEVPVVTAQLNQSLLSGYDRYGRQIETAVPDYGPSTFFTDANTGLAIVPVDDVFIVQALPYVDWQNAAGVATEEFALASGDSYTLEWAVYPTGSKDYYDFVNNFRTVEGRIARMEKTPGFVTTTPHPPERRKVPTQDFIDKRSLEIGIFHSLSEIADDPEIHIDGIEFRDFPLERALLAEQVAAIHAMDPDFDVALHIAHSLYATNNPDQFADSKVIVSNGQQASWGDGSAFGPQKQADGWRWWGFYPTPGNSFHDALIDSVDILMDEMGFDGGFMDGFMAAYTGQYTYDGTWDGYTAEINPATKTIARKKGSVLLLSQPSLIEYARKIRDKDGVVIANSGVLTRSMTAEDYIIFDNEISSGPEMHLAPTVTALGNPPFLSEKHLYYDMLDKLSWGELFISYSDGHTLTHETLASMQFPITFREIDSGMVRGDEKVVTMNPGIYGWSGDSDLHMIYKFDSRGALSHHDYVTTIDGDVRTELTFSENESAVLEQVPLTVAASSPVNAQISQYDTTNIKIHLHGNGPATLNVRNGDFSILPGVAYATSIGGATSMVTAQPDGSLNLPLSLAGATTVVIGNNQVQLDVFSIPTSQVLINGSGGLTNFSAQVDDNSQVTLTAPDRATDSSASSHNGFIATQGSNGTQIYDSNGVLLKTFYQYGKAMEFDEDANLFLADPTPVAGKYRIWRFPYLGNNNWAFGQVYCQVNGQPRALAIDSGTLYIGLGDAWNSNVYTCAGQGHTPVLFGGPDDPSRQLQDIEIDPDGKLWTARVASGYQRFPLTGGFEPELTIYNNGKVGGFEFGPDRNGDGRPELYGNVDDSYSNIGYYDYQTGQKLGTLISDNQIDNYSLTFGADRNGDGYSDIHVLNYYDRIRIYDGVTGDKLDEMAAGLPIMYVSGGSPKPFHFLRWTLNGTGQTIAQNTITFNPTADTRAVAIYSTNPSAGDIEGDYNRDGQVDNDDYAVWFSTFGSTTNLSADGNTNGVIDTADYTVWHDNQTAGSTASMNASTNTPLTAEFATADVIYAIPESPAMATTSAVRDEQSQLVTTGGARLRPNQPRSHDDAIDRFFEAADERRFAYYLRLPKAVRSGRPNKPLLPVKPGFPTDQRLQEKYRRFQPLQAALEIPPVLENDDLSIESDWQRNARRKHQPTRDFTRELALELAIDEFLPW